MYGAVKPHYTALFLSLPKDAKSSKINSSPVTGATMDKSEPNRLGFVYFLFRKVKLWNCDTDIAIKQQLHHSAIALNGAIVMYNLI